MDLTVVTAHTGRTLGSASSRRLRNEGTLPGVVYGMGKDPVSVSVDYVELRNAMKTDHGLNTVINLAVDGGNETVILRAIQRDSIKRTVTHADFMRVDLNVPIQVVVPVHITGHSIAVAEAGALVEQKMYQLRVLVKPSMIPVSIDADISGMTIENRLQLAELNLPEGVTTRVGGNITVAAPVATRISKTAEEEEAELEAEALEAAEGEDGEGSSSDEDSSEE